jgi:hypothetical protein
MTGSAEYPYFSGCYRHSFLQKAVLGVLAGKRGTAIAILSAVTLPSKSAIQVTWLRHLSQTPEAALQILLGSLALWAKDRHFSQLNF